VPGSRIGGVRGSATSQGFWPGEAGGRRDTICHHGDHHNHTIRKERTIVPSPDALRALLEPENQQINWAIGDLLRERAGRPDWRRCPILQHLETNTRLELWNELFHRTREALANEADLPAKAQELLQPSKPTFDQNLDDFIAEMVAVQYLSFWGHTGIRFLTQRDRVKTDLISEFNEITYVTEAKNMREPNSLAFVAFGRWHENQAADPNSFNFLFECLRIDDPSEDLTLEQVAAIRGLIDELPNRRRPSEFDFTLPGDRSIRISISDGAPVAVRYGPGPFLVNEAVEEWQRGLVVKVLEPARKALTQLYSRGVPPNYRKLLFFRWKPPEGPLEIGEADNVRAAVLESCQAFIRRFFPDFALAIMHTGEQMENTPRPNW
jgi:hypothetical protein